MIARLPIHACAVLALALAAPIGCKNKDVTLTEQPPSPVEVHAITGTVTYRARIALPPDAQVHVRLEDLSLPDTQSRVVNETRILTEGRQPPIAFTIQYDPEQIQQSHRYSLRATIDVGDITLFASTQPHPVLTQSARDERGPIHIEVQQVPPSAGKPPPPDSNAPASAALQDTRWLLVELEGQPAIDVPGQRAVAITLQTADNVLIGSGGVNNFSGGWSLDGDKLTISPGPMTMMAGPEPLMAQEQSFIRVLMSVKGWRITGSTLELIEGDKVIAKFKPAR